MFVVMTKMMVMMVVPIHDGGSDDDESGDDDGDDGNFLYLHAICLYGAQNSIPPTDSITSSPSPSSWPDVSGLMQPLFFLVTELAPAARWSVMAPQDFHCIGEALRPL